MDESPAKLFRALGLRRTRALVAGDFPIAEALHARHYELITPAGKVLGRDEYLAMVAGGFYASWAIDDFACRASAAICVIRYKATLGFSSGTSMVCWHTDVYEDSEGHWRAVWSQATEIRPR